MYGAVAAVRESSRRSELPARHDGRGDRDRPLVRARRRHAGRAAVDRRPARRRLRDRERPLQDHAHLRQRELESGAARAAGGARRRRIGRRLHRGDQRRRAEGAGQHLSAARRHGESSDRAHRSTAGPRSKARGRSPSFPSPTSRRCARARGSKTTAASVDKLSGGQLAYVYLPNTGQPGYASFNRYYFAQQDKKGAIIDERYNGGGSAADYIIDVLQREFDGYFNNVAGDRVPFTSPAARHLGTEGDDHQRNGRLGRRPDAVDVQAAQDRRRSSASGRGAASSTPPTRRPSSTAAR